MKVLFVCLGNICRSPLAEGIMRHRLVQVGLDKKVIVDSCGTSNYHIGSKPDSRTRQNAEKNGVKLSHLGRQLTPDDMEAFDLIIAMDKSNRKNILSLEGGLAHAAKVKLMREFDSESGEDVPDPYYGSEMDFQEVFEILDRSVNGLINHLRQEQLI